MKITLAGRIVILLSLLALGDVPGLGTLDLEAQETDRIPVHQARADDLSPALDSLFDEFTATVRDSMAAHDVPGLGIAVVDRDRLLWSAGFGVRDRDTGEPVTPETVFSVQSISKLFTGVAALRAVEEGILELDAAVTEYLPDFTVNSRFSERPASRMTVRHLLRHAAGFTHEAPVGNNWGAYSPSMEAHVRSIQDTWLKFPVGTGHAYSNLGYDLVGYILQEQSGRAFQDYVDEKILDPLGMHASFVDTAGQRLCSNCAAGHRAIFASMPEYVPMTASGGVRASAEDGGKFLQFLLHFGERPEGDRILEASSFDEIYRPTGQAYESGWPDWWFGMGVIVQSGTGVDYLLHTHGGGFGYRASLEWMPGLGIGAAVFTNSDEHDQIDADLVDAVLDSVFARDLMEEVDAPGVPRAESFFKNLPDTTVYRSTETARDPTPYRDEWERYLGTYRLVRGPGYEYAPSADLSPFEVEITEKDGHLHFGSEPLIEHEPGLFFGANSGEALDFRSDPPTLRNIELERVEPSAHPASSVGPADEEGRSVCGGLHGAGTLPRSPMVLVGEMHGTDAGPAAFGTLACRAARRHGAVAVGLEISHQEQDRIDRFLGSAGRPADRRNLLAGRFWTDSYQDGRRSRAMADLLDRLRALGSAGIDVKVVAFDPLPGIEPGAREKHLAKRLIAARRARPDVPFLVLTGNLHARTRVGVPGDESFLPMGALIESGGVDVLPIEVRHAGGSAWICTGSSASDCGPRAVEGPDRPGEVPSLELFSDPDPETGYAGALRVGHVDASPPAVGHGSPDGDES